MDRTCICLLMTMCTMPQVWWFIRYLNLYCAVTRLLLTFKLSAETRHTCPLQLKVPCIYIMLWYRINIILETVYDRVTAYTHLIHCVMLIAWSCVINISYSITRIMLRVYDMCDEHSKGGTWHDLWAMTVCITWCQLYTPWATATTHYDDGGNRTYAP